MIQVKRRLDYQPPAFSIPKISLTFELADQVTTVRSTLSVEKFDDSPLILDGTDLELAAIMVDGTPWQDYSVDEQHLTLRQLPRRCEIAVHTRLYPEKNTALEGLYQSGGSYCTQCEAEGFRRITYFPDRPDVLASYTVRIEADKTRYPNLLSNGNCVERGELEEGRHYVVWHDPFNKPCYLFALVAGQFDVLRGNYTTSSGREVQLEFYVDEGNLHKAEFALQSLQRAMRWDEDVYGLEYDLDVYMVVAVDFFNMGAMENKGLNVFNAKYVLADADSATDTDYFNIESIIAHEYFHNWTGNRVTCRDWFQLSLKEGLTVFRDQQFSADMSSPALCRVQQAKVIREQQFAEDASPMAHPIRPDEVIEMNNFYTVTVYDKGAEVIRMLFKMLGKDGFRKGMDKYFSRHDGQAVTCDDFVQAMADANHRDLTLFKRWYSQSGTPQVSIEQRYDPERKKLYLDISQHTPATMDQASKRPLLIPIEISALDEEGHPVLLDSRKSLVLELEQKQQSYVLSCEQPFALNVLRDFSAPIKLRFSQTAQQRLHIALYSDDGFSRVDAMQGLYQEAMIRCANESSGQWDSNRAQSLIDAQRVLLNSDETDLALLAEMLSLPSFETLMQLEERIDVDALMRARDGLEPLLACANEPLWLRRFESIPQTDYQYEPLQVAARKLKNHCLLQMMNANPQQYAEACKAQYQQANNMTDTLGALKAAQNTSETLFDELMQQFEQRWHHAPTVMDKWFALHAGAKRKDILSRIDLLQDHAVFSWKNPNRVRALVGTFGFYNPHGLYAEDGSGVRWLTEQLIQIDKINPQVSARLVTPLLSLTKLDDKRQLQWRHELMRLADQPTLSVDLSEKVHKALNIQH
ncbi:aminopeptidase N [Pseudobowmanella zhangzhouensis]|uniref:Aminopeptidase N n=1 Tax=Pseudobowmanella zhangzhouensis TaxID=1537679 RepID=A0ABW1XK09_9ALTE